MFTIKNAMPKTPPWRPKLSGTASAATNIAAIAASMAAETQPLSVSTVLVSHAYDDHAHQSAAMIKSPFPTPLHVGSSESTVVTCVNPKAKTRSNSSSRGVTRCSLSVC